MDPATRHVYGDPAAPVTVVEFGDLECPHCRASAPVLRELVDSSEGRVRLVWRHFPLFEVHPHALTAALAAEAAGAAGQFWPMHDLLLAHQNRLTDPDLRAYARELGVDPATVTGDAAQGYAPAVEADYLAGLEVGARSTPTLLVGDRRLVGEVSLAVLRAAVAEVEAGQAGPWPVAPPDAVAFDVPDGDACLPVRDASRDPA